MKRYIVLLMIGVLLLVGCAKEKQGEANDKNDLKMEDIVDLEKEPYFTLYDDDYEQQSVHAFDSNFYKYKEFYEEFDSEHPYVDFMESLYYSRLEIAAEEKGVFPILREKIYSPHGELIYTISWDIANKDKTTVKERDNIIDICIETVCEIFSSSDTKDMYQLQEVLNTAANNLSTEEVNIYLEVKS